MQEPRQEEQGEQDERAASAASALPQTAVTPHTGGSGRSKKKTSSRAPTSVPQGQSAAASVPQCVLCCGAPREGADRRGRLVGPLHFGRDGKEWWVHEVCYRFALIDKGGESLEQCHQGTEQILAWLLDTRAAPLAGARACDVLPLRAAAC